MVEGDLINLISVYMIGPATEEIGELDPSLSINNLESGALLTLDLNLSDEDKDKIGKHQNEADMLYVDLTDTKGAFKSV